MANSIKERGNWFKPIRGGRGRGELSLAVKEGVEKSVRKRRGEKVVIGEEKEKKTKKPVIEKIITKKKKTKSSGQFTKKELPLRWAKRRSIEEGKIAKGVRPERKKKRGEGEKQRSNKILLRGGGEKKKMSRKGSGPLIAGKGGKKKKFPYQLKEKE